MQMIPWLVVLDGSQPAPGSAELKELLRHILNTVVEMKCQRGYFDVEDVKVGMEYDPRSMANMTDKEFTGEEKKRLVVKAVLSDGIVKRLHRGAKEVSGRACRARVIVALS